jgi:hypothetical protein
MPRRRGDGREVLVIPPRREWRGLRGAAVAAPRGDKHAQLSRERQAARDAASADLCPWPPYKADSPSHRSLIRSQAAAALLRRTG